MTPAAWPPFAASSSGSCGSASKPTTPTLAMSEADASTDSSSGGAAFAVCQTGRPAAGHSAGAPHYPNCSTGGPMTYKQFLASHVSNIDPSLLFTFLGMCYHQQSITMKLKRSEDPGAPVMQPPTVAAETTASAPAQASQVLEAPQPGISSSYRYPSGQCHGGSYRFIQWWVCPRGDPHDVPQHHGSIIWSSFSAEHSREYIIISKASTN